MYKVHKFQPKRLQEAGSSVNVLTWHPAARSSEASSSVRLNTGGNLLVAMLYPLLLQSLRVWIRFFKAATVGGRKSRMREKNQEKGHFAWIYELRSSNVGKYYGPRLLRLTCGLGSPTTFLEPFVFVNLHMYSDPSSIFRSCISMYLKLWPISLFAEAQRYLSSAPTAVYLYHTKHRYITVRRYLSKMQKQQCNTVPEIGKSLL